MIVVDASVWVSGLTPRDSYHAVSRNWLASQHSHKILFAIPIICLAEVSGAIARVTGYSEDGEQVVEQILTRPNLRIYSIDHSLGLEAAHLASQLRLRGADAVYVALAQSLNVPLVTWDKELIQRNGQAAEILQPV